MPWNPLSIYQLTRIILFFFSFNPLCSTCLLNLLFCVFPFLFPFHAVIIQTFRIKLSYAQPIDNTMQTLSSSDIYPHDKTWQKKEKCYSHSWKTNYQIIVQITLRLRAFEMKMKTKLHKLLSYTLCAFVYQY